MKREKRKGSRSIDGSRLITIVSVALVLLVLGITLMLGLGVHGASRMVRSNMGFVAVIDPSAGQASVDSVTAILKSAPYVDKVTTHTADDVLARWEEIMGPDEMLDVNPFLPEYEVKVKPQWAHPDSLAEITSRISEVSCIDHVQTHAEVAAGVNHSVSTVMLVLLFVGFTLLVVSIVLIANTVKLQLYSQRFIIHTQQYVGATSAYIVAPYMKRAALDGLIASVLACVLLVGIAGTEKMVDPVASVLVTWVEIAVSCAVLVVAGVTLCTLTARFAARKYVNSSYEEIFQ